MKLSKIEVTYERTKQIQQYEPAKASVTIGYVSGDDEEPGAVDIAVALDVAKSQVTAALGLKTFTSGNITAQTIVERVKNGAAASSVQEVIAEAVNTSAHPTEERPIRDRIEASREAKKRGRPVGAKGATKDPAAMEDVGETSQPATSQTVAASTTDPAAMEDEHPIAEPKSAITYTAQDLSKAVNNKMAELVKAKQPDAQKRIMGYVNSYKPKDMAMTYAQVMAQVPEDKRADFINGLKDI